MRNIVERKSRVPHDHSDANDDTSRVKTFQVSEFVVEMHKSPFIWIFRFSQDFGPGNLLNVSHRQ